MTNTQTPTTPTAVRTWNRPHTKATVTITFADGTTAKAGGARAERCSYALLYSDRRTGAWRLLGLRSEPKTDSNYGAQFIVPITEGEAVGGRIDWIVSPVHHQCATCDQAANEAISLARVTGATGATFASGHVGNCGASVTRQGAR
jgi:hypothetical protein